MNNKLIYLSPLMALLFISMVSAVGVYSLRGSGGDIVYIGSENSFLFERVLFSAHIFPMPSGAGQGMIILQATTTDERRINLGIHLKNAFVEVDNVNTLKVISDAYYFERIKDWNGFLTIKKVEGKVTYVYNKNKGLTNIVGYDGLKFGVGNIKTINLKR